jgi:integrase
MKPTRLTDRIVNRLPLPDSGNGITFDTLVKGLGCRVTNAGARSFILTYRRKADGLQRRFTIGSYPDWTVAAAREEVKRLKREIDAGADPVGANREARAAATVADLCDRFEREYIPRKRPSTQISYRQQIAADIRPVLGRMKVAAISLADVDAWHSRMSKRAPTHANRALALLSRMLALAIRWGLRPDNPCKGIERNQETKRQRFLSGAELTHVTTALDQLDDQGAANAIRLLLLTGARRGELLAARWRDINIDAKIWIKPASTTKQKTTHRVPLSEAACRVLTEMREQADENAEWVFPASRKAGHRTDLKESWEVIRSVAAIPDVRLHDCRHSFASILASEGLSLPIIGALLGHASTSTTHRYAHLIDDPLRQATERVGAIIAGKPAAEIVPLKKPRR